MDVQASDLPRLYRDTRERLTALVAGLDDAALTTPVPTCPGWLVADVVAHLAAVVEDALASRLTGPPSEEQTAEQVARYKGRPMTQTLAGWTAGAPQFEEIISAFNVPQAVIDVASHEQDIRGALGQPGARDTDAVRRMGRRSRDQLAALDWSGDPAPVLDHLVVFGPARTNIIE